MRGRESGALSYHTACQKYAQAGQELAAKQGSGTPIQHYMVLQ